VRESRGGAGHIASFSKASPPRFTVGVFHNEHLPEGGREVDAIVTVTATGGGTVTLASYPFRAASGPGAGVVIMVNCSGSMAHPPGNRQRGRAPRRACPVSGAALHRLAVVTMPGIVD
jgi:hypothetical protein